MASAWKSVRLRLAAGTLIVGAVLALVPAEASAHSTTINHGVDFASINSTHTGVTVCDREDDNHSVAAYVRTAVGTATFYDTFGGGCSSYFAILLEPTTWRLCELTVGCSIWRTV